MARLRWTAAALRCAVAAAFLLGVAAASPAPRPPPPPPEQYRPELAGCAEARLALTLAQRPADDPTALFWRVQRRVLELGCRHPEGFEYPDWFVRTSAAFVGRLLRGEGRWPELEAGCRAVPHRVIACSESLVSYHISVDLPHALGLAGCGHAHDWRHVGGLILTAAQPEGDLWTLGALTLVPLERQLVRWGCLLGLPPPP